MEFEEAKVLYEEKGKSFLLKATLKHGHSAYVETMLFAAIEDEHLVPTEEPTLNSELETLNIKSENYEQRILRLESTWRHDYKRAVFLHNQNVFLTSQHFELIKFGQKIPVADQLAIDANTREIHTLFRTMILPTWKQLDELKKLKKLPEEAAAEDWPKDPFELVKLRNNYRSYVSRSKKGHTFNDSLEVLEAKLAAIELKIKQLDAN